MVEDEEEIIIVGLFVETFVAMLYNLLNNNNATKAFLFGRRSIVKRAYSRALLFFLSSNTEIIM